MLKQVIVMRRDLKMRRGKEIAQGAHACVLSVIWKGEQADLVDEWIRKGMTKICVRVDTEEEFQTIIERGLAEGLRVHSVMDAGKTEFHGIPTMTCCVIGPDEEEKIDKVTGHLKLL